MLGNYCVLLCPEVLALKLRVSAGLHSASFVFLQAPARPGNRVVSNLLLLVGFGVMPVPVTVEFWPPPFPALPSLLHLVIHRVDRNIASLETLHRHVHHHPQDMG